MPKLVVELGDLTGSEFRFDHELVIGRDPACDVAIPERIVSRHQAMLRWNNDECYVVDLGSANGTFINQQAAKALFFASWIVQGNRDRPISTARRS